MISLKDPFKDPMEDEYPPAGVLLESRQEEGKASSKVRQGEGGVPLGGEGNSWRGEGFLVGRGGEHR